MEQWFKMGEVNIFKSASNMIVEFSPVDNLPEINWKYKSSGGRDLILKKLEILINKYFKCSVLTLFKFTLQFKTCILVCRLKLFGHYFKKYHETVEGCQLI